MTRLRPERSGVHFSTGTEGFFSFTETSKRLLRSTQPTIQWVPKICVWVAAAGTGGRPLNPYNAKVKNEWTYTSAPHIRL